MLAFLLALQAAPGRAPPQRLHYHLVHTTSIDAGAGMAPLVLSDSAFVAITLSDSADVRVVVVRIFWNRFDGGAMASSLPPPLLEHPTNVTLHGYVDDGLAHGFRASDNNLQAMQLVPAIRLLLAGTRNVAAGDSWVDSTLSDSSVTTAASRETTVTRWTARSRATDTLEFRGTVTGATALRAGALQLGLQTAGESHLTAKRGEYAVTATTITLGQGTMAVGDAALDVKVRTTISATLFPADRWAQIP